MRVREKKGRSKEDWGSIMEALLHGTPDAKPIAFAKLNRLVSGFLVNMRAFDYRGEWEDLRQIVLMKLVQSFSQGKLREPKAFVEYARIVTRHEFYDFLRAHQATEVTSDLSDLSDAESRDETATLSVRSALQSLPEKQQKVVQAVYVEGRTY